MTPGHIALLFCVALIPSVSPAQLLPAPPSSLPLFTPDSVRPGLRVKLFVPGIVYQRAGTIRSLDEDVFVFEGDRYRELVRVPRQQITWMQVSTDRKASLGRVLAGTGLGVLAGLGIVRLIDNSNQQCGNGPFYSCSTTDFLIGTTLGGAAGALIATSFPAERWRSVRLR